MPLCPLLQSGNECNPTLLAGKLWEAFPKSTKFRLFFFSNYQLLIVYWWCFDVDNVSLWTVIVSCSGACSLSRARAPAQPTVLECRRLRLLFAFVYEPAVKDRLDLGKVVYGGMRRVCACVRACPRRAHTPIWTGVCTRVCGKQGEGRSGGRGREEEGEEERLICIHHESTFTCQSNSNPPPTLPSTDGHPSAPSRDTHTLLFATSAVHAHTQAHASCRLGKSACAHLVKGAGIRGVKMEWLKHMIRNREGSH